MISALLRGRDSAAKKEALIKKEVTGEKETPDAKGTPHLTKSALENANLSQQTPALTTELTNARAAREEAPGEDSKQDQQTVLIASESSASQSTAGVAAQVAAVVTLIAEKAATTEIKEPLATAVQWAHVVQNASSSSATTVAAQPEAQQLVSTEENQSKKSSTKVSSKSKRNRRREGANSKKEVPRTMGVKPETTTRPETTKAIGVVSASTRDQQADVHANCKKTIASLKENIQHWKSVMQKISIETQATNSLSAELKLAAIRGICDQEGKKGSGSPTNEQSNQKKNARRRQRRANQSPKQAASPSPCQQSEQQPLQRKQRRYPPRNARPRALPQGPSNLIGGAAPQYDDQSARRNRDPKGVTGDRDGRSNQRRYFHYFMDMQPWGHQRPSDPSILPKRNRFELGPHFHSQLSASSINHTNQHFNYIGCNPVMRSQQSLPLFSSAAESDHPICVNIREEFRRAEDAETLIKLITKAEVHKIQDLAEFGRRKLEKLQKKQCPSTIS